MHRWLSLVLQQVLQLSEHRNVVWYDAIGIIIFEAFQTSMALLILSAWALRLH